MGSAVPAWPGCLAAWASRAAACVSAAPAGVPPPFDPPPYPKNALPMTYQGTSGSGGMGGTG